MRIRQLWRDESGAGMVEYSLLVVLIALTMIGGIYPIVKTSIEGVFDFASQAMKK
jgi:Flp pilus assembly pilin Flp